MYRVAIVFERHALHIRAHDILQPRGEIVPQLHLIRGDTDVAVFPCGVRLYARLKCFILGGVAPFSFMRRGCFEISKLYEYVFPRFRVLILVDIKKTSLQKEANHGRIYMN